MLKDIKVGLAITGSFCNYPKIQKVIEELKVQHVERIIPIISKVYDTRFYEKDKFLNMLKEETGEEIIDTIVKAEPIGPKNMVDIILVVPCTGNTIAKLANGITDTPVTMAVKSHIRNNKPIVIGVSTNDGLGVNLKNIGILLDKKNYYFVPFRQDDYINKPKSLVLDYSKVINTTKLALKNSQIEPLLV